MKLTRYHVDAVADPLFFANKNIICLIGEASV